MSKTRKNDVPDWRWQDLLWNRPGISTAEKNRMSMAVMDIDTELKCGWCHEPLVLIEASVEDKIAKKHHTLEGVEKLATKAGLRAYFARCSPDDGTDMTVSLYRLKRRPDGSLGHYQVAEDLEAREYQLWEQLQRMLTHHQCVRRPIGLPVLADSPDAEVMKKPDGTWVAGFQLPPEYDTPDLRRALEANGGEIELRP